MSDNHIYTFPGTIKLTEGKEEVVYGVRIRRGQSTITGITIEGDTKSIRGLNPDIAQRLNVMKDRREEIRSAILEHKCKTPEAARQYVFKGEEKPQSKETEDAFATMYYLTVARLKQEGLIPKDDFMSFPPS